MFSRPVLLAGVLAAAVGVPYLLLDDNVAKTAKTQWQRITGKPAAAKEEKSATGGEQRPAVLASSPPAVTIEEAFRFDVQPSWVVSRFASVSTVAGDPKQLGMRVPLVTGTRPDDVAGSLTYYFNQHHELQRLTFTGQSADARRLLATVVTRNGLRSLPTTDAAHYVGGNPKKPTSEVVVKYLPLIESDGNRPRTDIAIDLRRSDVVGWEKVQMETGEPKLLPTTYRQW
jgi:hypothetical protein